MKFFVDTANIKEIEELIPTGFVDGVTTNPSLIAKNGDDMAKTIKAICSIVPGPVSAEVTATDFDTMLQEGEYLASLAKNVAVKVPLTPNGLKTCKTLREKNIMVNVTLCFTAAQALLAAKARASFISPFVGRVEDNSFDGVAVVREIASLYSKQNIKTEVLAASLRDVHSVARCYEDGADIVTMPPAVFEKMYKHILTDKGLDQFDIDYAESIKE